MPQGFPVVIAENGKGFPVHPVESGYPLMTIATNGKGAPIVISDLGAPFVVDGYTPPEPELLAALSSDDGALIVDDNDEIVETY